MNNECILKDIRKGWISTYNLPHIVRIAAEVNFLGNVVSGKEAEQLLLRAYNNKYNKEIKESSEDPSIFITPFGEFIMSYLETDKLFFVS